MFIYDRNLPTCRHGIPSPNFIIIYLGAICVLILFQAKLVKLLTEKNNKFILNSFLFVPCLFVFLFFPIIQFFSIYFATYEFNLSSINVINQYFTNINYINWFNKFKSINTLVMIGFTCTNITLSIF